MRAGWGGLAVAIALSACAGDYVNPETGKRMSRERACIAAQTALAGVASLTKDDDRRLRVEALWLPLARAYCG